MKNLYNKKYFSWMKKYVYGKNVSYWIQNSFDLTKIYLDNMKKTVIW